MKVEHKVHGVSPGNANVPANIDGEDIMASVPCLEVELVSLSDRHGNQTLRFTGSAMNDARELFKPDALITTTYEAKAFGAVADTAPASVEAPVKKK